MMKHINTINNCKSLYFLANKTIYTIEDEFQTSTFIDNVSFNRYLSILNLSTYNNNLYYFNNSELYKIVINKLEEVVKLENVNGAEIVSENTIFSWQKLSRKEYLYTIRNFNNQILWSFQGSDSLKCVNGVIFRNELFDDTKFEVLDLKTGFPLWSYTLPEGFKIFGQVQVIDNLLILYAVDNNFDHSKTIALDINSGNMKWELDNTIFCQGDTEKKLLLGYAIRRYEVIDPFLGEKIVQKNMMDYYEKGLSPVSPNNTIANGKLWFVSGRGENAKFGRINIETSEVDFIQDFPLQNDGQLSKPVFYNGYLYLLDSNNTLHIFEE